MKKYLLLSLLSLAVIASFSQENHWIRTKLPGLPPVDYQCALGETCMIFADDTSQAIHAFDINEGAWKLLLVPTELEWVEAAADGNVAMILNDSIAVAYSALTSSFSVLSFKGNVINLNMNPLCIKNFAYVLTDQFFYVFDAEESEWVSHPFTPPGSAPWQGGVYGKDDFLYLSIFPQAESVPSTWIAYSLHTKTFEEYTVSQQIFFRQLDHGFTFTTSNTDPYLCGGYSAITGQVETRTHSRYITENFPSVYEEMVSPLICNLFLTNEPIDGNNYRYYMWVYNTVEGNFAEYSFYYTYTGGEYVPVGGGCGGQTAYVMIKNTDKGERIECLAYSAKANSFVLFDTPLYNWGFMSFSVGGQLIDGYDKNTYFLYDVESNMHFTYPVQWAEGIHPGIKARGLSNTWAVFAFTKETGDTTHVLSYTRDEGNLSAFEIIPTVSTSNYRGADFYGLLSTEGGVPSRSYLFSPIHNHWMEKNLESSSYRGSYGNYFYINYTDINQTSFYDAVTDKEFFFPSAHTMSDVHARDSLFFMYSAEGKYIAYSIIMHDSLEYTTDELQGRIIDKYVVLNIDSERYGQVLYDAYNNIFAPLVLTENEGQRRRYWTGGKTALILTENRYLYAYTPEANNAVGLENNAYSSELNSAFEIYPNPVKNRFTVFLTDNKARSSTSNGNHTRFIIYDLQGRKRLEKMIPEGKKSLEIEVSFLPNGIYYCQLTIDKNRTIKKLVISR